MALVALVLRRFRSWFLHKVVLVSGFLPVRGLLYGRFTIDCRARRTNQA